MIKKRDQSLFEDCLTKEISHLPETYATTFRTFKKFLLQIQNALRYSYSNGLLECLNNHIKVLKHNAYGFRNFYYFKRQIVIRHGKTILINIICQIKRDKTFHLRNSKKLLMVFGNLVIF